MTEFNSTARRPTSAGVTLMNNQVGYVVAKVMDGKKDVTIRELPSMIRVDGISKIEFDFEEIAEALGWDDFGQDDFEEIMSTHYGRMVVLDDRVLMFANPEDAAEYIGFDLAVGRGGLTCTRRTERSTSSSTATCTSGTRARRTGCKGQEEYAKGWIECFHAYQGLGPAETHWTLEHFQKYSVDDFEKDVFVEGGVDHAVFQSTYLKRVVHERLQRHRAERGAAGALPRQAHRQRALGPARGRGRAASSCGPTTRSTACKGVKLYTAEWREGSRGWTLRRPRGGAVPRALPRSSASRTSTSTRGRRSGRWTRTPSTSPTSTTRRRASPT